MIATIGLSDEQHEIAEMVVSVAERFAVTAGDVRDRSWRDAAAGAEWQAIVDQGLHAIHLPESADGAGGTLLDAAVVLEQLASRVHPGPVLATFSASAVCAMAQPSPFARETVAAFASGATGAVSVADGLTATPHDDGWIVNGTITGVVGAAQAEHLVLSARHGDELIWFVTTAACATPVDHTDITRGVADVTLENEFIGAVLTGIDREQARAIIVALAAAESAGVAGRCVMLAVEHARLREQFGRTLSAFQSMQQRLALMHVRAESARAAAWDAVNAIETEQRDLAIAAAAVTAFPAAIDNAVELVITLGAMGFTWENDAHVLWRRALANVALDRSTAAWHVRLGHLAETDKRDIRLTDDTAHPELRAEVAAVLAVAGHREHRESTHAWLRASDIAWQRQLADAGLVSPHLPAPHGRGADPSEQDVIAAEFRRVGIVPPDIIIGNWVLPTIITHGTAAQSERFVAPTLSGEILWCQLFSEPGAGSDLASVATRATRVDGGWRVTGQKVWNSLADVAQWGAALVRTDATVAKHQGLSYFLIDMASEGITVRPIRQATGLAEFCEVFLDNVFVPDDCVVGEPGDGWKLATTTLANERLRMGEALGHGDSARFRAVIANASDDETRALARAALGRAAAREAVLAALTVRGALQRMQGRNSDSETSVLKVANIVAQREGSIDLMAFIDHTTPGQTALTASDTAGDVLDHLGLPAVLMGGGTPDIQLGIIARKVLALP